MSSLTASLLFSVDVADKGLTLGLATGASRRALDVYLRSITALLFVIDTMRCLTHNIHNAVFMNRCILCPDLGCVTFAAGVAGLYGAGATYFDIADATVVVFVVGTTGNITTQIRHDRFLLYSWYCPVIIPENQLTM